MDNILDMTHNQIDIAQIHLQVSNLSIISHHIMREDIQIDKKIIPDQ